MTSLLREKLLKDNPDLEESLAVNEKKRGLALAMRSLRKKAGLTQLGVAEKSGLSQSHVSKIEAATGPRPQTETLIKYAEACGADVWIEFLEKDARPAEAPTRLAVAAL